MSRSHPKACTLSAAGIAIVGSSPVLLVAEDGERLGTWGFLVWAAVGLLILAGYYCLAKLLGWERALKTMSLLFIAATGSIGAVVAGLSGNPVYVGIISGLALAGAVVLCSSFFVLIANMLDSAGASADRIEAMRTRRRINASIDRSLRQTLP